MANRKLKVELELETARAKAQAKSLAETAGGGSASSAGGARLGAALDKAAKSAEKTASSFDGMNGRAAQLTRGFAGIAVGMATSYAANYVTNPNAKAGLEYTGSAVTGAVGGAMMAGPFALYAELGDDGTVSAWKLRNCIWNVGGVTHEAADGVKVEEEIDSESEGGYVYVSFAYVNTDSVTAHFAKDLDALHKAQVRYDKYCVPLYRFKFTKSEDGAGGESAESKPTLEIVDLRRAPQVQSFESDLEFASSEDSAETSGEATT